MARKKRGEEARGSWLDTYADMVTLLLTFFVMLLSMSTVDENKLQALLQGLGISQEMVEQLPSGDASAQVGDPGEATGDFIGKDEIDIENDVPESFNELYEFIKAYTEKNNLSGQVTVVGTEQSVYIRFKDNIFFDGDSYYLRQDSGNLLDFLGRCFKALESNIMMINIYGHTATVDDPYYPVDSMMLSSQRAANVAIRLRDTNEIDAQLLNAIGQGNSFPVATNDTPEGRAENRRVDMAIVSTEAEISSMQEVQALMQGTFDELKYPKEGSVAEIILPEGAVTPSEPSASQAEPPPADNSTGDTAGTDGATDAGTTE